MNLISNNCVGGWLYKELNMSYNNPFIWNIIQDESFLYLVNNFSKIDFNNRTLITTNIPQVKNREVFAVEVDNSFVITYPHYVMDNKYDTVTKCKSDFTGWDIRYKKMDEYILSRYDERKNRMLNNAETPVFIIDTSISTEETNKKLEGFNIKKIMCIVKNNYTPFKEDTKFVTVGRCSTVSRAKKIIEKYRDYLINE